jgi:hypothetical protein
MGWVGLTMDWVGLDWIGLDWIGPGLGWIDHGLDWIGSASPPLAVRTILHDNVASSVRQLKDKAVEVPGGVGEDQAAAKAAGVMLALEHAILNVQEQFTVRSTPRRSVNQPSAGWEGGRRDVREGAMCVWV